MPRTIKAARSRITIPPVPSRGNSDVGHIVAPHKVVLLGLDERRKRLAVNLRR
jgi:hypothetical protein